MTLESPPDAGLGRPGPLLVLHAAAGGSTGFGHLARSGAIVEASRRRGWRAELLVEIAEPSQVAASIPPEATVLPDRAAVRRHRQMAAAAHAGPVVLACDLPDRRIADFGHTATDGFDLTALLNGDPDNPAPADAVFLRGRPSDRPVPARCIMSGHEYEVVRPAVRALRPLQPWRRNSIDRVLVSFGGSDPGHQTEMVAEALRHESIPETVLVIGPSFGEERCRDLLRLVRPPLSLVVDPASLPAMMLDADLIVSMGGQSVLEALNLGRPVAAIRWDELGRDVEWLAEQGLVLDVGPVQGAGVALRKALRTPERLSEVAEAGWRAIDGRGADRCVEAMANCLAAGAA